MNTRIEADYWFETAFDPLDAAEAMAGEQSSGTFVPVPGETPELRARAAARVERLEPAGEARSPSLPGAAVPKGAGAPVWRQVRATLSWPIETLGPSLPNLVATVAGNLFELGQLSGLRLLDLRLPVAFAAAHPGPRFGVRGTRALTGVHGRPLIGTIVKPSVGLSPDDTAALAGTLAEAGIDFVKDDELQSDGPACPFAARAQAVMQAVERAADRTGRKCMVAFNLTGDVDEMRRRHDLVLSLGGTAVMVSLNAVGLAGFLALSGHSALPIHAHRNGWGYLSRAPALGWDYAAWSVLWRVAGADHLHVNGFGSKFSESDASVLASVRALARPLFPENPMIAMPVFSSGQTVHRVAATWAATGSPDLIFAAGGGILAHPHGPAAGVVALREAWEAAMAGIPLADHARGRPALAAALAAF